MSKPQITIKDIARELGVSPSTVSRALKDNPDISQETREAIHKYAREQRIGIKLAYKPFQYNWSHYSAISAPLLFLCIKRH